MHEVKPDWGDLYVKLYSFADFLLRFKYYWFRGKGVDTSISGKQVHDYVTDAIEMFFKNQGAYSPTQHGSIDNYIKNNILKNLVRNDARSKENQTSTGLNDLVDADNPGSGCTVDEENLLPFIGAYFDQQMDYNTVMAHIEAEAKGDAIVEQILVGIQCGLLRRDIKDQCNMSDNDYDNGMRRLKTIFASSAKKYDLKPTKS